MSSAIRPRRPANKPGSKPPLGEPEFYRYANCTTTVIARILAFFLMVALVVGAYAVYIAHDRALPTRPTIVNITPGMSLSAAAQALETARVTQALPLRVYARLWGKESAIRAGALIFPAHENLAEVLDHLTDHARTASIWVTIPEGYTAVQIEQRLRDAHLSGAAGFATYARHTSLRIGGVTTPSLEGYLFPDTYLVRRDAAAPEIAQAMVAEFRRVLPADAASASRKLGETIPDAVTVASLIEREAQSPDERPLMAGVYYHRLRIGMQLEVDASLEYAMARHETEISGRELRRDTPYNTYLHAGLPPTPIANPGLPSLRAALHPVATPYLYYVYKGGGRHAFAETYQEHQANVARYLR